MPLIQRKIPLRFGQLDQKTDPRHVVPGDLVALQNVDLAAWPRLKKRPGTKQIASLSAAALLAAFKKQLLVGTGAEAYSVTAGTGGAIDKGALESLTLSAQPVRRDAYVQTTPDSAVHPAGVTVYTWETSAGGAQYSVFDTATGQPIVAGVSLGATAAKPKALALGPNVIVLWYDTGTNHIRFLAVPATNPTNPTAAADLAVDPATTQVFDATVVGGLNGLLVLLYANNGASNKISLRSMTAAFAIGAEFIPTTTDTLTTCCTVFPDPSGQKVWTAFYNGTAIRLLAYDAALTVNLNDVWVELIGSAIRNIAGIATDAGVSLLYEVVGSASYNNLIRSASLTPAGAVTTVGVLVRSVGLASKPFVYLGRLHYLAAYQSALQSTYFLMSGTTVVGKLAPGVGGGLTAKSILPEVTNPAAGVYGVAYLQADQLSSSGGNVFTQAGVMAASFDFTQPQTSVELSDNLHFAGGVLSMYDGQAIVEHGFHLYPENVAAAPSGTGGLITAGQYQYVVVYEWMDAQGLVHQSSPSPPVQVTTSGSTSSVALTVPTLRLTAKGAPVSVVVYRTQANQAVFYRLTSIASPLLNSTAADTVSYTDAAADTAIGGNAQLVANPLNSTAELPALAAPAVLHAWRYRNRVAAIPAENPYQWIFSKAFVAGVPIEFNDQNLYQSVAQDGGPLTCGIEMDEKNILFSASRIYYVVGDGPAPNGTSPDYGSSPQNIPTDVGCSNRRSLALTPFGVMFQASAGKGIYLLSRGLTLEYVGAGVEPFNGLNVTSARLAPDNRRVIFFTDGGVALVFDYYQRKWIVYTGQSAVDAVVYGGLVTQAQAGGLVLQETPGAFTDNGSPVLVSLTTSIISFAGLSGVQRVYRVNIRGDYRSPHSLSVAVAYDDSPVPSQVETVGAAAVLSPGAVADTTLADTDNPGGGAFPAYEWVVKMAQQKCASLQLTISESQEGPNFGEGFSLSGVTFIVGEKAGSHKVAASKVI